jgi:cephalosporin hydroxylase
MPAQHRPELNELASKLEEISPETLVEIGTARGGTLYVYANYLTSLETIVSIDIGAVVKHYNARTKFYSKFSESIDTHFLFENSHAESTGREVENIVPEIDVLIIDGDPFVFS